MNIEAILLALTAALEANTAALTATGGAPAQTAPKPAKAKKVEPTPEPEPTPAPAPKTSKLNQDSIRTLVRNERERLKADVSAEAVAAHKEATRKVCAGFGYDNLGAIADKDIQAVYDAIAAINVEADPDDEDDL